jgi:hypothetical protein
VDIVSIIDKMSAEKELGSHADPEAVDYDGSDHSPGDEMLANKDAVDSKDMYRMGKDQQFRVCIANSVFEARN